MNEKNELFLGKKVLILGAAGSIGSVLAERILSLGVEKLMLLDNNESGLFDLEQNLTFNSNKNKEKIELCVGDIRDSETIRRVFEEFKPNVVYHAAAYKHVPLMEKFYLEAVKNNIFGTYNVLKTARDFDIERFVFISTDKAVNPISIMGMSKRIGELLVKSLGKEKYFSVRFGNVERTRGSVIPLFERQIANGGPVTITDENMERYFISKEEACDLIFRTTALGKNKEIFILDMGSPRKIIDLAKKMISESDKDIEIKIVGMRPGERLGEELFSYDELKKINGKIYVLENEEFDKSLFLESVEILFRQIEKMSYSECKKELSRISDLGIAFRNRIKL